MPFSVFIPCKYLSADFVISNAKFFHFSRKATFIHSHITDKKELSEGDIKFAEQLFNSFHLPVLWFGLQILTKKCRETKFYSVQKSDTKLEISSVCWEMEGEDDIECFADDSVHNLCGSFVYLL